MTKELLETLAPKCLRLPPTCADEATRLQQISVAMHKCPPTCSNLGLLIPEKLPHIWSLDSCLLWTNFQLDHLGG